LMSAGSCNMNCRYCFIPKNKEMDNIHKQVIQSIKDGTYIELLKENKDLECLSLWGTEPTLTLKYFIENVDELFKELPKLNLIKIPSNLLINHMDFVELQKRINGRAKLDIQISLDGGKDITDKNRKEGSTETIIEHYKELIDNLDNKDIKIYFKPTISIDNMEHDLDTLEKLTDWYRLFDDLAEYGKRFNVPGATPTFVVPGEYTSEDGKKACEFFKRITALNKMNKEFKLFKHCKQLNNYVTRFMKLVKFNRELYKSKMYTCSGGDTQYGLDFNGNLHMCHHTFYWDNETYYNDLDNDRKWILKRNDVISKDDLFNRTRTEYLNRTYHDYMTFRINYIMTMVKELALAGQADKEYLKNDGLGYILGLFLNTCMGCPIENMSHTGSQHLTPVSVIRLLGNGCMQEIIKEAYNDI
ncbi:MAG: 4Fe-4S cluster-binding domain-containing protein, partial [Candidatus Ratteibacteria bacterium]|nr:4Fe-4S cluster-binding domain-containing protein [Candidatus Ratteibacteria bacterium]